MSFSKKFRPLASLILAVAATAAVTWWDIHRMVDQEQDRALRLARQITTQAESMTLKAREQGEKDPLGWAVSYLTQGVEPRATKVVRWQFDPKQLPSDVHKLDREHGIFEYSKMVLPESGAGIRVFVNVGYVGFAGTTSRLASDLAIFTLFLMTFGLLYLTMRLVAVLASNRPEQWIPEFRHALTETTVHFRDLVRSAYQLVQTARECRNPIGEMRQKIHGALTEIHHRRRDLAQTRELIAQVKELSERLVHEAPGPATAELQALARTLLDRMEAHEKAFRQIEIGVEPLAVDADQAFQANLSVQEAANAMSEQITQTREALLGQSRLSRELDRKSA